MNVAIFWDIASCSQYMNQHFGGMYRLHLQCRKLAEQETFAQQVSSHMDYAALHPRRGNIHVNFVWQT
jgi:hypothetical protein